MNHRNRNAPNLYRLGLALIAAFSLSCSGGAALEEKAAAAGEEKAAATSDEEAEGWGRKPIPPPEEIAKLPPDGGPEYNRLVFEKSPYLLQHAANPVDWYPWGEEAFAKAREEDKPVFLSVGYSTCHWCHVMERESFEDEEVAEIMNEHFVSIKVDREERPDVDQIYMTVTQALTGSGGWPMTVVMTPEKKPFFAGTYFPKTSRLGRPGMMDLLPQLGELWETQRERVEASAEQITAAIRERQSPPASQPAIASGSDVVDRAVLDQAYRQLASRFDAENGGFAVAPKFPTPHNLLFLLRYWKRTGDEKALEMVEKTLTAMRRGGIYDQVGFGFHRYSTDPEWLVPHFEKMLYDQAMLAMAYTEAYQATGRGLFAQTAREIFSYVLRDMTSEEGGFYSAEDADSEGEEGRFYLWTTDEVKEILGAEAADLFVRVYNLKPGGNFREPTTGETTGKNILHLTASLADWAEQLDMPEEELRERLEKARRKLFEVRERRVHPFKDDKILTDWNGLMIAALAKASRALDEPRYERAATRAAEFVLTHLRKDNGRLIKRYRQGEASLPAHLEDYAFLIHGLIELYETSFELDYLRTALDLNETMIEHFWDDERGGFYLTADDSEELLIRPKELYDGAIPSGNSVAALDMLRLGRIAAEGELETRAQELMQAFRADIQRAPSAFTFLMTAVDFAVGPSYEVVIVGERDADDTREMLRALRSQYVPNKVVVFRPGSEETPTIAEIAGYTVAQKSLDGKATAYVCRNYACKAPTTEIETMIESLKIADANRPPLLIRRP